MTGAPGLALVLFALAVPKPEERANLLDVYYARRFVGTIVTRWGQKIAFDLNTSALKSTTIWRRNACESKELSLAPRVLALQSARSHVENNKARGWHSPGLFKNRLLDLDQLLAQATSLRLTIA